MYARTFFMAVFRIKCASDMRASFCNRPYKMTKRLTNVYTKPGITSREHSALVFEVAGLVLVLILFVYIVHTTV